MKAKIYRGVIIGAIAALVGLLAIQGYWFVRAFELQEAQFDERVNLALRNVADGIYTLNNDQVKKIDPVTQVSSNSFYVDLDIFIDYRALDSLLKSAFKKQKIFAPFNLAVYTHRADSLLVGSFYEDGILSPSKPTCISREQQATSMNFAVTFPNKETQILGALNIWIFSALTFVLILILFGLILIDLRRQKNLATMKADFINNMTHELQTPIANISMASEVLKNGKANIHEEKAEKYLDIIYRENQRLKHHVEQVLQTAMMDRGEIILKKKELNLHNLMEEVLGNFQLRVLERNGRISSSLRAQNTLLIGDPFHLSNIFYNLLDNADKYSTQHPEISVTTENKSKGILISIADRGIGISRDVQQYIFDKFYRVSSGNVHDVKGFGLGLTYVREIVVAHQGIITVSSEPGEGSRFELYFPLQAG